MIIYGINKNLGKIININEILDKYSISHEKVQILSEINDKSLTKRSATSSPCA